MTFTTESEIYLENLSLTASSDTTQLKYDKNVILHVEEVQPLLGFLDLPREIRDHCYEIMFLRDEPLYPSKDRAGVAPYSGLLGTNHQVYTEAVEILYGKNIFQIRGVPAWTAPDLLNIVAHQSRDDHFVPWRSDSESVCIARFHLKKLYIPSHNISLDRLKHIISLLKYFPNLKYLRLVYSASFGVKDMEVINVCRLLKDRRPLLDNFLLYRRKSYDQAQDISWMVNDKPYRVWSPVTLPSGKSAWHDQNGVYREAVIVPAPQRVSE